ncbi:AlpA family phage regulatory protein [Moraxella osloensis]|nr:AlpA family phage regulatory protein [Moraxella osloensis]
MPQLIPLQEVIKYTGLSRATIYRLIDEKSDSYDPSFPKKVQLSQVRIAWVASEVADWINDKIASRSA